MGDAKMTAEDRLRALPGIGPHADLTAPFWRQLPSTVIALMEAHAAAVVAEVSAQKDGAYDERNRLVAALAAMFPSAMSRHPDEDTTWDDDWRWIVFVDLPTGQASWHIHDSHLPLFAHVQHGARVWDGHTATEKYERVARFCNADAKGHREVALVAAAVAEVEKERDDFSGRAMLAEGRLLELLDVLRERTDALDAVAKERDEWRNSAEMAQASADSWRVACTDTEVRALKAEARVAELEALLRESQDLFMEAGPFHALRPAIKAQWRRRARAHINALASALAPQAPPARREGEIP